MVNINVVTELDGIPKRVSSMTRMAQYALVNQVHADMNNYVPFRRGDLRNQSSIGLNGKSIIYNVPYAKIQYHGKFKFTGFKSEKSRRYFFANLQDLTSNSGYTTAGTGPYWDKKAKSIHMRSWEKVAKRAMR